VFSEMFPGVLVASNCNVLQFKKSAKIDFDHQNLSTTCAVTSFYHSI